MLDVVLNEYFNVPVVTRTYITLCVLTTCLIQLDVISPLQIYFNPFLIFYKLQLWRMFTNFLFFGTFGFSFIFHMVFLFRYSVMLEEGSFRGRLGDFLIMFCFGLIFISICGLFYDILFLGPAFATMLIYIWGRRNPYVRLSFYGIISFTAPYLPWVILLLSLAIGNSVIADLIGILVGHIYFYLEDVFPNQPGGFRMLKTPSSLSRFFRNFFQNSEFEHLVETENPGGYDWNPNT